MMNLAWKKEINEYIDLANEFKKHCLKQQLLFDQVFK